GIRRARPRYGGDERVELGGAGPPPRHRGAGGGLPGRLHHPLLRRSWRRRAGLGHGYPCPFGSLAGPPPEDGTLDTLAGLFGRLYRADHHELDLSSVRLHVTGADAACRALGARAMTVGADIYFRDGAFAPHTCCGLWLLAHEVAHVIQQARGPA